MYHRATGLMGSEYQHFGYLYMGSPAKEVRPLSAREREFFPYTAANYVRLKDQYLQEGDLS